MERAIQVNDYRNITLSIEKCNLSASQYTVNVINGASDTTLNISHSEISGR